MTKNKSHAIKDQISFSKELENRHHNKDTFYMYLMLRAIYDFLFPIGFQVYPNLIKLIREAVRLKAAQFLDLIKGFLKKYPEKSKLLNVEWNSRALKQTNTTQKNVILLMLLFKCGQDFINYIDLQFSELDKNKKAKLLSQLKNILLRKNQTPTQIQLTIKEDLFEQEQKNDSIEEDLVNSLRTDLPNPSEIDSPNPSEIDLFNPSEIDLSNPSEIDLSNPSEMDLSNPSEIDLFNPSEIDLFNPSEIDLSNPSEIDLSNPSEIDLSNPSEIDLSNPSEIDLSNPSETDFFNPLESDFLYPLETDETNFFNTLGNNFFDNQNDL